MDNPKRILLTPLNWGLGHVTRSIPIIRLLQARGASVFLASDGAALRLLEKEFPDLPTFELPSYGIRYPGSNMVWNMAWQMPRLFQAIYQEKKAVARLIREWKIDIIISDNRYGCRHPQTRNIFLTHQLHLKIPFGPLQWFANRFNHQQLRQFEECWIPDVAEEPNLAGSLAHPPLADCHYLGLLSRMQFQPRTPRYDIVVVLSGPEPQRTLLEEKIIRQIKASSTQERILLIQGRPDREERWKEGELEVLPYLTSRDLNEILLATSLVVCRSGYSSLMDLAQLGIPALLIPTPGQTEQEYLAEHLMEQGRFYAVAQKALNWEEDVVKARGLTGFTTGHFGEGALEERISALLES